jgi:hypothetical protein
LNSPPAPNFLQENPNYNKNSNAKKQIQTQIEHEFLQCSGNEIFNSCHGTNVLQT